MVFGPSTLSFANSDVMGSGGSSAWDQTFMAGVIGPHTTVAIDLGGNIDADPMFVGSGDDPFMLAAGSPCIDTGDNDFVDGILTDILGNPRIINGTVDMGAYEYFVD
jgi:hypothetical protein